MFIGISFWNAYLISTSIYRGKGQSLTIYKQGMVISPGNYTRCNQYVGSFTYVDVNEYDNCNKFNLLAEVL